MNWLTISALIYPHGTTQRNFRLELTEIPTEKNSLYDFTFLAMLFDRNSLTKPQQSLPFHNPLCCEMITKPGLNPGIKYIQCLEMSEAIKVTANQDTIISVAEQERSKSGVLIVWTLALQVERERLVKIAGLGYCLLQVLMVCK